MGEVVVITGPIGAGKSTVTAGLAARLAAAGLVVAVADLDDVAMSGAAPADRPFAVFEEGRRAHGTLVAGWVTTDVDIVLVPGHFVTDDEQRALLDPLPPSTAPRWVHLDVTYDVARARTADDATRTLSRDPVFLRGRHERHAAHRALMPPMEWVFDATVSTADEIVATLAADLLP